MRPTCVIAVVCAACQGSASQPPAPPATSLVTSAEPAPAMPPPVEPTGPGWEPPTGPGWDPRADAAMPARADTTTPPRTPTPLPAATHGRAIISVAIADDGGAALTLDSGNGVRLWPALDGTREPVAVPLVAPQDMVLARRAGGFEIAALDTAGGLVLLRVDAAGQLAGKTALPLAQPYAQVVAAGDGFLALRADQTIERLDAQGASLGTLAPETGQRIAALVARRDRALVMVASADGIVARWLDTTAGLAWGQATPLLALSTARKPGDPIDPVSVVLSPDHARLAAVTKKSRRGVLVDLATGVVTPLRGHRTDVVPLNWVSADRVAFAHDEFEVSRVEWFDTSGKLVASIGDDFELEFVSVLQMEAADDRVVSFMGHQLVLVEPRKLRYLGYQMHAASRLRATPAGMVAAMGGRAEMLDDALQIERRIPSKDTRDLLPLDDTFAVAITGIPTKPGPFDDAVVAPQPRKSGVRVVLFEGETRRQVLALEAADLRLRYEPATRLLATNGGSSITFARFDTAEQRFGAPVTLALGSRVREIYLLDPAATDGAIALAVLASGVRTIHEDELTGAPARASIALPGDIEAVDRAGHVFVRHDPDTVAIHRGMIEIGRLTGAKNMKVRPAPDGKRVALFGRGRVMVAALDGTQLWSIGFPGVKDLQWSDDELVALANGIAKLDAATGATIAARCGWRFGLRSTASFMDLAGSTLCDR